MQHPAARYVLAPFATFNVARVCGMQLLGLTMYTSAIVLQATRFELLAIAVPDGIRSNGTPESQLDPLSSKGLIAPVRAIEVDVLPPREVPCCTMLGNPPRPVDDRIRTSARKQALVAGKLNYQPLLEP